MMHQDSLEPAAIRFTLERLQESARRSGYVIIMLGSFLLYCFHSVAMGSHIHGYIISFT